MRINPFLAPIVLIVALVGTALTAQAVGRWTTSGRAAINPDNMTPADLKGWMTLQEVMDSLKLSQVDLYAIGNIPAGTPPTTALKDMEAVISVTALRDALTKKLGASGPPASIDSAKGSPNSASTPVVTPAATAAATRVPNSGPGTGVGTPTPLPAGQVLAANQIKGSMTLKNVSDQAAIPLDKLIAALQLPKDINPDTTIKELISQGKFAEVTNVQKVVAELQTK